MNLLLTVYVKRVNHYTTRTTVMGAAYGTAKSSVGISAMAVMRPELMMKSIIPVIMAGIIAIYGLVVSFVLNGRIADPANGGYTLHQFRFQISYFLRFIIHFLIYKNIFVFTCTFCDNFRSFAHMAAGLTCGFCGLGAGYAIGEIVIFLCIYYLTKFINYYFQNEI